THGRATPRREEAPAPRTRERRDREHPPLRRCLRRTGRRRAPHPARRRVPRRGPYDGRHLRPPGGAHLVSRPDARSRPDLAARAAATARSVATMLGPFEFRYPVPFSPTVEVVDHRILGTWSARGAEALLQHNRSLLQVADDITLRDDEVLSLQADALLVRRTNSGTDRAGGGAYERVLLALFVFGTDGLVTRIEYFDTEREDQALARFDELTAAPPAVRFA